MWFKKVLQSLNTVNSEMNNHSIRGKKKKKSRANYRTNQNIRIIINVFLRSQLQFPCPCHEGQFISASLGCPALLGWSLQCCEDSSDSNLALLLHVLASDIHSCQNQSIFFCENTHCPFTLSFYMHRVQLFDHVDLICSLYSWWKGFQSSSLVTLPLEFNCSFVPISAYGSSIGVCF